MMGIYSHPDFLDVDGTGSGSVFREINVHRPAGFTVVNPLLTTPIGKDTVLVLPRPRKKRYKFERFSPDQIMIGGTAGTDA